MFFSSIDNRKALKRVTEIIVSTMRIKLQGLRKDLLIQKYTELANNLLAINERVTI